jgi:hypothetical protein
MRIGERQFGDQSQATVQARNVPGAFGEGLAAGLRGLGGALQEYGVNEAMLAQELRTRREGQLRTAATTEFIRLSGDIDREVTELRRAAPPGAPGVTDATMGLARARYDEFLAGLPDDIREEIRARAETAIQGHTTNSLLFELEQTDAATTTNLNSLLETARSAVYTNPAAADEQLETFRQTLEQSGLPPTTQAEFLRQAETAIRIVQAERLYTEAAVEQGRRERDLEDSLPGARVGEVSNDFTQENATVRAGTDLTSPSILMVAGTDANPRITLRMPDGQVLSGLRVGAELPDGSTIRAGSAAGVVVVGTDGRERTIAPGGSVEAGPEVDTAPGETLPTPNATRGADDLASVAEAGQGYTTIITADGRTQRRQGSRAWRNNNPGNIEFGAFAQRHGAIGTDGRFAVFPTYQAGRDAKEALLFETNSYRNGTLAEAITRYAPPSDNNDTAAYITAVSAAIGVNPNTPLASLTPQQRQTMLDAMEQVEGFTPGSVDGVQLPPRSPNERTAPDIWTDPRFASLTHEQRLAIVRRGDEEAERQLTAARQEILQRESAFASSLISGLGTGETTTDQILQVLQSNQIRTSQARQALQTAIAGEMEQRQLLARTSGAIAEGRPMGREDSDGLNLFETRSGIRAGVVNGDAGSQMQLATMFGQTGRVSDEMAGMLAQMAMSQVPGQAASALNTLRMMMDTNDTGLASTHPELYELAQRWDLHSRYSQPGEAETTWRAQTDPAQAPLRRERRQEAVRHFAEEVSDTVMLRAFQSSSASWAAWVGGAFGGDGALQLPGDYPSLNALRSEFYSLYVAAFERTGNTAQAVQEAATLAQRRFVPSTIGGGNRLMYLAPESAAAGFETIEGSHAWIDGHIRHQFELTADEPFALQVVMDPEPGERPHYYVIRQNEDGLYTMVMDENNRPRTIQPSISDELRSVIRESAEAIGNDTELRGLEMRALEEGRLLTDAEMARYEELLGSPREGLYTNYTELNQRAATVRRNLTRLSTMSNLLPGQGPISGPSHMLIDSQITRLRNELETLERQLNNWNAR